MAPEGGNVMGSANIGIVDFASGFAQTFGGEGPLMDELSRVIQ